MTNLLRRSELALPACNDHMFDKGVTCGADLVFLDLEDATPVGLKVESRAKAIHALTQLDWGRTARAVRINGLDTEWCHDDIIEILTHAGDHLDTIVIPKAKTARDVWWVDVLLTQLEAKLGLDKTIRLEVLIEEVEGLANAEDIVRASPRLDAVIFGVGDFSLSQGARVDTNFDPLGEYPGDFWVYARNKIMVAARIAGIDAIDSPYPDYRNLEGYERDARRSSLMGYTGKWAIHPDQVPIANEVYAPTTDEIARAERNVAAYREAEAKGRGAVGVEGVLVDAAHVKMAEETLARAALISGGR
ncbi:HpcH/HpaI aldolase/citrate lyase family protein [Mycolicibacterium smegmatis]|uniref:Citrate (Pro-3S)-lyase n=2 Tax=Mycolicibacterium smegmatis (strain ATCC 700084 / mc(2)155) TaxID=246196 RepID=I7FNQ4_MYCS2|nr:CoA ester lyase [Mycolicibacterium smegmatis]ABK75830.1 malyl-CoA lyase [Mycolicibacterium smegmatis MC2 155]AFP42890.1 Citrate (Pro-3S)-lyase [Mycolicibacterium smegmatis MC2 155]AIU11613.1 citryl-CoA lyase [Mycolicibacterium smegmatis MC2 155]AIU18238.1 citryl-CoA lyase [Mycolicibacterium smegmatis]AIU24860.1 citryl-CoA lyase [Mycolicibacterium smegmatis]